MSRVGTVIGCFLGSAIGSGIGVGLAHGVSVWRAVVFALTLGHVQP